MSTPERERAAVAFYAEHYDIIRRLPFDADRPIYLRDHEEGAPRGCRFCRRRHPGATFRTKTHAAPEFFGNRSLISLNECDECNKYLADSYEDHLGKWLLLSRSLSKTKGKRGYPTFSDSTAGLRVEGDQGGLQILLSDAQTKAQLESQDGPISFKLPVGKSQPHVPLRAAKALVKVACSVCPTEEVDQCRPAIDWLMRRNNFNVSPFPVLFAFTPGPISSKASGVIVLRRKVEKPMPYLWCMIGFANYRFQYFVPFCRADSAWLRMNEPCTFDYIHLPSRFGWDWPYGTTKYYRLDWSGTQSTQSTMTASFQITRIEQSQ